MDPVRILLVDDQVLFRKGVRALLGDEPGMTVVGEASDGFGALECVRELSPDLVLMDVHMPACDGVEATRLIKNEVPRTRIVMLTVSDEDDDLFAAIKSGAEGYLLKDLKPDDLFEMIRGVMRGECPISATVAGKLLTEFRNRHWQDATLPGERSLTAREIEVLQLVTQGCSNGEIAARLFIVQGTVKNHLHNILEKLRLENRLQAATYAIREGLATPPRRPTIKR